MFLLVLCFFLRGRGAGSFHNNKSGQAMFVASKQPTETGQAFWFFNSTSTHRADPIFFSATTRHVLCVRSKQPSETGQAMLFLQNSQQKQIRLFPLPKQQPSKPDQVLFSFNAPNNQQQQGKSRLFVQSNQQKKSRAIFCQGGHQTHARLVVFVFFFFLYYKPTNELT